MGDAFDAKLAAQAQEPAADVEERGAPGKVARTARLPPRAAKAGAVEGAIAKLRDAQALATGALKAVGEARARVGEVEVWLREVGSDGNQYRCFHGRGYNRTAAQAMIGEAIGQVMVLRMGLDLAIKGHPAPRAGSFQAAIARLEAAREYLEVLAGEKAAGESKLVRDVEQAGHVTGAIAIGLVGAPLLGTAIATAVVESGVVTIMLLHPIETVVVGEIGLGVVLQIGIAGGLREFLEARLTPQGVAQTLFELVVLRGVIKGGSRRPQSFEIELEEIETAPGSLRGVVRSAPKPATYTTRDAADLIARSKNPPPGAKVSDVGAHVPLDGDDAAALASARDAKVNTTVYRVPRQAEQDVRDAMNQHAAELAALKPGGEPLRLEHTTSSARQAYNATRGEPAVEATFRTIQMRFERLPDGSLHLPHFAPQATTKFTPP